VQLPAQTVSLTSVLMAGGVLLVCCVGVFLMLKSRRPDPKMIFLMGLLNASADLERDSATQPK
jgi:hypothetical protein